MDGPICSRTWIPLPAPGGRRTWPAKHPQAAGTWQLKFLFDDPYCAYFGSHPSSWRVWLSDPLPENRRSFQSLAITVDGKTVSTANASDLLRENLVIDIPAGLGKHVWTLRQAR
jgi:hypothetical protein